MSVPVWWWSGVITEVLETESGEPNRLTAAAHRRAEFLRPLPSSVPARGLRCVGREEGRGGDGAGE